MYFHPLSREKKDEFDKLFVALATRNGQHVTHDRALGVWGRKLGIPASADGVAKFTFEELCGRPLSAADYLEVTKTFRTVFLTDVPKMNLDSKDKARRFITFIDGEIDDPFIFSLVRKLTVLCQPVTKARYELIWWTRLGV